MMDPALRSTSAHVLVEPPGLGPDGDVVVDAGVEHHLRRVLRLRDGERVSVTDGEGRWCPTVLRISASTCALEPVASVVVEPRRDRLVTLASAIPKGDRLDWMVQKLTELGADRIVLLHADRSTVRWQPDRVEAQLGRLRRISDEACRQSRRVWRVQIDPPIDASAALDRFALAEPGGRRIGPGDVAVAVGPEGGWSPEELAAAAERVDLGPHILRTETAAVAACTLCVTWHR